MSAELSTDELIAKVERGVDWLTEHYEEGFWFHYEAAHATTRGLPMKPPVNWDADKAGRYGAWESALGYWYELHSLLEKRTEVAA